MSRPGDRPMRGRRYERGRAIGEKAVRLTCAGPEILEELAYLYQSLG